MARSFDFLSIEEYNMMRTANIFVHNGKILKLRWPIHFAIGLQETDTFTYSRFDWEDYSYDETFFR